MSAMAGRAGSSESGTRLSDRTPLLEGVKPSARDRGLKNLWAGAMKGPGSSQRSGILPLFRIGLPFGSIARACRWQFRTPTALAQWLSITT